ncbi:Ig-like domain-containing protein [Aeromicrobium chenweiae]|uniref:Signal peptidase I n=1 Tax=Aeromicrobium chenweiae TaxID=2079793 RepID=A0A2S0WIK3_9ACTN|nr:Ig-like domain-containing protein [Aeromicrobium chenweiae]AWB91169.1 signal peptidase I [Aeromicrobium chenweiae]TGN31688.1 signal peptidase I [Aeromicrobium chenweiae]
MTSTHPRHRDGRTTVTRRLSLAVGAVAAVVASVAVTGSSSATFTASTRSTSSVSAAADWTPPSVGMSAPPTILAGTSKVTAVATDAVSGVDSVTIQHAAAGTSSWTTICETWTAPYTCDWNTTSVPDGAYDMRAVAVDKAGNRAGSATARTTVANSLTVSLDRPGDFLRGTVATAVTVNHVGTLTVSSVRVEFAPTGSTSWTTVCTSTAKPYTCSADTRLAANGTYDVRAVATVGTATSASPVVTRVVVDNLAPTVRMTDPGTPLKGTKTFTTTAADDHSGIAEVVVQAGSGTSWTDVCVTTSSPFTCSGDTTRLGNGTYGFRAVATDKAGNVTTSTAIANRVVQNASVTLVAPSTHLRGNVTLQAQAQSSTTIRSVKIQRSVAGANAWTDICTDTTSPYSCSFATAGVTDGSYDLRAVLTETDGTQTTSAVVTGRIVDNTPGKGVDIQTTNGGVAGRIDAGDTIVYTFSEQMDLSSIYSGWSGAATSGTVRVRGGFFSSDTLEVSAPSSFRLGTLELNADFALWLVDYSSDVSISAETVPVDTGVATVVTIKILSSSSLALRSTTPANIVWSPSSSVTDLAGNPTSTSDVTESGPLDVDF